MAIDSTVALTAPVVENTSVVWTGPAGTFTGNTWIIPHATQVMTGDYTAKYTFNGIEGCISPTSTIHVLVYNPYLNPPVTVYYKDQKYRVLHFWKGDICQIWLYPDKNAQATALAKYKQSGPSGDNGEVSPVPTLDDDGRILLMDVVMSKMTKDNFRSIFMYGVQVLDQGRWWAACLTSVGAAGCLLVSGESGETLLPVCLAFVKELDPSAQACLQGFADDFAAQLGHEKEADVSDFVVAASHDELTDALIAVFKFANVIIGQGGFVAVDPSGVVTSSGVAKPSPGPTPSQPGSGGSPSGVLTADPCATCAAEGCGCQGYMCICGSVDPDGYPDPDGPSPDPDPDFAIEDPNTKFNQLMEAKFLTGPPSSPDNSKNTYIEIKRMFHFTRNILSNRLGGKLLPPKKPYTTLHVDGHWMIWGIAETGKKTNSFLFIVDAKTGILKKLFIN